MLNIAVLVSGSGTNLQALIDAEKNSIISNGEIKLVISDKESAYALERAQNNGIKNVYVHKKDSEKLLSVLAEEKIELIVLAGYLSILPQALVEAYPRKIMNIHPSLIPSFCGKGFYGEKVHKAVLESGVKYTGATVHFVDSGIDTGTIIIQKTVEVLKNDTVEMLQQRVLNTAEHLILVEAVKAFTENRIEFVNGNAWIIKD